jgi:hypothetical protein
VLITAGISKMIYLEKKMLSCLFLEKRTYNGLPDFMTKVAQEELGKLDASIKECNILYLPQVL